MFTRTLVQEIDDIRAGRWDNKIRTDIGLPPEEDETPPAEETPATEAAVEEEEPIQLGSVDMEVEEAAEVEEQADSAIEAVRLTYTRTDSLCLTCIHTAPRRFCLLTRSA